MYQQEDEERAGETVYVWKDETNNALFARDTEQNSTFNNHISTSQREGEKDTESACVPCDSLHRCLSTKRLNTKLRVLYSGCRNLTDRDWTGF